MTRRGDVFPRVQGRQKGYARKQVESLLASVDATIAGKSLAGRSRGLTAGDIRRAGFELVRGGYDTAAVDAALDGLEERVLALTTRAEDLTVRIAAERELAGLCNSLSATGDRQFPRVRRFRHGHSVSEVDLLFGRICHPQFAGSEVTVDELRGATFRRQRGGYDQDAVDHTLDRVIELMLVTRLVDLSEAERPPSAPRVQALRLVVRHSEGRPS